jgi:NAD-dependent SIR2 family protein deacetylase
MKRVRCPKCDNYLTFDETKYDKGQSIVFICPDCKKQFGIRIGKSKLKSTNPNAIDEDKKAEDFGHLLVIENVFGFKQQLYLEKGENIIGRRCKGTEINQPIESSDRSMDRRHCIITIKKSKKGKWIYTLRDNRSVTGTFLHNRLLEENEQALLHDEDIITIGATTFIFYKSATETK